ERHLFTGPDVPVSRRIRTVSACPAAGNPISRESAPLPPESGPLHPVNRYPSSRNLAPEPRYYNLIQLLTRHKDSKDLKGIISFMLLIPDVFEGFRCETSNPDSLAAGDVQ